MRREPLPTWISNNRLTCLLGDAAHPFLPTSIQGCSQAIEDGCVLAVSLALSHAASQRGEPGQTVPRALQAWERLRYNRVKNAQIGGEVVRKMWHAVDWTKVRANPELVKLPRAPWLLNHDCERHTLRVWSDVVREQTSGGSYVLPDASLAAGPESDEFTVVLPPSPTGSPVQGERK